VSLPARPSLCRGRVVRVDVLDPQGCNRKLRPAVVLSTAEEVESTGEIVSVCVSRRHDQAPPEVQVALPFGSHGAVCRSGLREPSWAVATWIITARASEVEVLGSIPISLVDEVLAIIARLDSD
jgi:hypothetical protein